MLSSFPRILIATAAAGLGLCGCASAPAPGPTAIGPRTEPGTILEVRPIVDVVMAAPPIAPPPSDGPGGRQVPRDLPVTPVESVTTRVIGEPGRPDDRPAGLSYTVRRAGDGVAIEVAQPLAATLAIGTRVQIVYDAPVRLVPY